VSHDQSDLAPEGAGPEAMRELVREYVGALHASYLDQVRHLPPAERGSLPLVAARQVTVVAAAARRLHLIATTAVMPPPQGQEVELVDDYLGLVWTLRFYDPSVVPELGLLADDEPEDVRRVLGVADTVYHLAVAVGGGLSGHHAQHSGVALANQHAKVGRDLDRLRRALPRQAGTVDELGICVRIGLDRAAALLAADVTQGRVVPTPGASAGSSLDAVLADLSR
jgi:hypothetical protein